MKSEKSRKKNQRAVGNIYEDLAAAYLEQKGYRIIERNYSNRYGEIDLIALCLPEKTEFPKVPYQELLLVPGVCMVICEVKFRTHRGTGDPSEAVTHRKIQHICRAAAGFYLENRLADTFPCRFDVICILGNGEIRHIEDAFSFEM